MSYFSDGLMKRASNRLLVIADLPASELISDNNDFSVFQVNLKGFLTLDSPASLVGSLRDDLMRLRVDRLSRRWPANGAIDAEGHPARLAPQLNTVSQLRRHDGCIVHVHR